MSKKCLGCKHYLKDTPITGKCKYHTLRSHCTKYCIEFESRQTVFQEITRSVDVLAKTYICPGQSCGWYSAFTKKFYSTDTEAIEDTISKLMEIRPL